MNPEVQIREWIKMSLSYPNIFNTVINKIETHFEKSASGINELKKRSKKAKGDLWEAFCVLYLRATLPLNCQVHLLKNIPEEIRRTLNVPKNDLGIDIVAFTFEENKISKASAIQCKYRHCDNKKTLWKRHGKTFVTYKDLSTFLTLCSRTGPWQSHIVMTNCDGASWKGLKSDSDTTLAKNVFTSLGFHIWCQMAGSVGYSLSQDNSIDNNNIENKSIQSKDEKNNNQMSRSELLVRRNLFYSKQKS